MKKKADYDKVIQEIQSYISDSSFKGLSEDEDSQTITINLEADNLYDSYSGSSVLNPEIYEYIDDVYKLVNYKKKLKLHFVLPKEADKDRIVKIFKAHYAGELLEDKKNIGKSRLIACILLVFGALIFIIYGLLAWNNVNFIFQSIIEIVAWVFIWEATSQFFFENASNKRKLLKDLQIFKAEII